MTENHDSGNPVSSAVGVRFEPVNQPFDGVRRFPGELGRRVEVKAVGRRCQFRRVAGSVLEHERVVGGLRPVLECDDGDEPGAAGFEHGAGEVGHRPPFRGDDGRRRGGDFAGP